MQTAPLNGRLQQLKKEPEHLRATTLQTTLILKFSSLPPLMIAFITNTNFISKYPIR